MPSFDTVCEPNMVEVKNAVENAAKEIGTRFDFKGTAAAIELKDKEITGKRVDHTTFRTFGPYDSDLRKTLESKGVKINFEPQEEMSWWKSVLPDAVPVVNREFRPQLVPVPDESHRVAFGTGASASLSVVAIARGCKRRTTRPGLLVCRMRTACASRSPGKFRSAFAFTHMNCRSGSSTTEAWA